MEYLNKIRSIQNRILKFLDDNNSLQYQNVDDLKSFLITPQSKPDKYELKSILYLISKITKNCHRCMNFYDKIKRIITLYKEEIKQTFTNHDIYKIFKKNKLLILILIEEGIITIDQEIFNQMNQNENYKNYFLPEIQKFQQQEQKNEIPENFEEKRREGENDLYICELIRKDKIVDFVALFHKQNISLKMKIPQSVFETNSLLLKFQPTLIEYAAFFGSVKIFKYLQMLGAELEKKLFIYAIHGRSPKIIHLLEEKFNEWNKLAYACFKESIKCHHKELEIYYENFINEEDFHSDYFKEVIQNGFQFYNFYYIPEELTEKSCFLLSIYFDHYKLVDYFKDIQGLNINEIQILKQNIFVFMQFHNLYC